MTNTLMVFLIVFFTGHLCLTRHLLYKAKILPLEFEEMATNDDDNYKDMDAEGGQASSDEKDDTEDSDVILPGTK